MGTFSQPLTETVWTEIADGATDAKFGIQLSGGDVAVAIAADTPGVESDNFVILTRDGDASLSLDLAETDKVYCRGFGGNATLRGYVVAR